MPIENGKPAVSPAEKTFAIHNLGCKVNEYEANIIAGAFLERGYRQLAFDDYCDVYIVNTCAVTEESGKKSMKYIRRARRKNPLGVVVAAGCYAQSKKGDGIAEANIVVGTKDKTEIVDFVEQFLADSVPITHVFDLSKEKAFEPMTLSESGRTRATVKIQDGCDNFCSYCLIPYLRGRIRSKAPDDIVSEVESLVGKGYKEIVLTGIHLDSYGKDLDGLSLCDVLERLDQIDGLFRIRLGSLEPCFITDETVARMKNLRCLCHQFHLSLQSGSAKILKLMRRRYTPAEYEAAVWKLREAFCDAAVTTDIIVGFPGEDPADFNDSFSFAESMELAKIHVFPYSVREGTAAAGFPNRVSPKEIAERAEKMNELAKYLEYRFLQRQLGKRRRVLVEKTDDFIFEGHTENYVPVRGIRQLNEKNAVLSEIRENDIVEVEIIGEKTFFCLGQVVDQPQ